MPSLLLNLVVTRVFCRPSEDESVCLRGCTSSSVLKVTLLAVSTGEEDDEEKSSVQSLSSSGMLRARSSLSLERDRPARPRELRCLSTGGAKEQRFDLGSSETGTTPPAEARESEVVTFRSWGEGGGEPGSSAYELRLRLRELEQSVVPVPLAEPTQPDSVRFSGGLVV